MITEAQIRKHLANYLAGSESLDDFEDWLVEHSWNMHLDSSGSAQELVNQIELRLSEHSSGHLSDTKLRQELHQFLENYSVTVEEYEVVRVTTVRVKRTIFSSAAKTLPFETTFQEVFA